MKRREFIKKSTTGVLATGVLAGCRSESAAPAVSARPRVQWRLASSFPPSLDTIFGSGEILVRRVNELTEGRFHIRLYPAGEIVPGLKVLDAVQQGTVQMGHTAGYYYIGKNPAFAFDTSIPFGLTARQQSAWLYEGGGLDLMREVYADFNIRSFPGGNTGAQMDGWFRSEVNSLQDLNGLKMRIPGLGGEVMNRLGVTVQVLAGGDIFPALERGAIDATEWVGPYDDEKLGFHQAAGNYYYPGWWEPGPGLSFLVNQKAWDGLPPVYQETIEVAAAEAGQAMMLRYDAQNPAALVRLMDHGVTLRPFPHDIMRAAQREAHDKLEETANKDAEYKKVYTAWQKFRDDSFRWFGTTEQAYANFVHGG